MGQRGEINLGNQQVEIGSRVEPASMEKEEFFDIYSGLLKNFRCK
jgi:hypothetical protein